MSTQKAETMDIEIKFDMQEPYLRGYGGFYVGSEAYFKRLHQDYYISTILPGAESTDYHSAIAGQVKSIKLAINSVLKDLEDHISIIHLINARDTENMRKLIVEFNDYIQLQEKSYGPAVKCIAILSLTDRRTGFKSKASQTERNAAFRNVKNGKSKLSLPSRIDTLRKAERNGIKNAATDFDRQMFLLGIAGKYQLAMIQDVLSLYDFQSDSNKKGKNGYIICSESYIKAIEKKAFGTRISPKLLEKRQYKKNLLYCLNQIKTHIVSDLNMLHVNTSKEKKVLAKEYYANLEKVCNMLSKWGMNFKLPAKQSGWVLVMDYVYYAPSLEELEKNSKIGVLHENYLNFVLSVLLPAALSYETGLFAAGESIKAILSKFVVNGIGASGIMTIFACVTLTLYTLMIGNTYHLKIYANYDRLGNYKIDCKLIDFNNKEIFIGSKECRIK